MARAATRRRRIGRAEKASGIAVHAFTASGVMLGFMALLATLNDAYTAMFLWLLAALVVDGIDGAFARRVDIKRTAPEFSGDTLDLVVDYVTYVLVPTYAMYRAELLPDIAALPVVALILITSALYFADTRMKTEDWYFRGFPGVWNLFAFFAFVLQPAPWLLVALVVLCSALTFAPIRFVHPMRVKDFRVPTFVALGLSAALSLAALWWNLDPPLALKIGLGICGAYFVLIGSVRRPA